MFLKIACVLPEFLILSIGTDATGRKEKKKSSIPQLGIKKEKYMTKQTSCGLFPLGALRTIRSGFFLPRAKLN